jgi:hypothetical protein
MHAALISIITQIAAGIVGGIAVVLALKEYSLGILKSITLGAFGAVSPPTVTATGEPIIDDSTVNEWVVRVIVALIVGGVLNLIIRFVKIEIAKNRSRSTQQPTR